MASFTSPARIRWPRSVVTGEKPTVLAPGAMAVNLTDKKMYVGDLAGNPVLFSQWIESWVDTKEYKVGDYVLNAGSLWSAVVDIAAGGVFDPSEWQDLSLLNATAQTWTDVSASRAHSTSYRNTTGQAIMVAVVFSGGRYLQVSEDDATWVDVQYSGQDDSSASIIIPNNQYYRIDGSATIRSWAELRS